MLAIYALDFISPLIGKNKKHSFNTKYGLFEVNLGRRPLRYLNEYPSCVKCGITGNIYFLLQKCLPLHDESLQPSSYYQPFLKMYHKDAASENHYLMTIDHIKPISRGGADAYHNYQTMCRDCNGKKSNKEG